MKVNTNTVPLKLFFFLLLLSAKLNFVDSACQSCLLPALHHHQQSRWNVAVAAPRPKFGIVSTVSGIAALKSLRAPLPLVQKSILVAIVGVVAINVLTTASDDNVIDPSETDKDDDDKRIPKPPLTSAMVATIGVYKNFISPLLPPACRFLPTCSQYGVQAIEEFGPTKGALLTAWRLLRCSPFGGKGYDPPRWPPVKYTYGSY